jgi:hypothetical protein
VHVLVVFATTNGTVDKRNPVVVHK